MKSSEPISKIFQPCQGHPHQPGLILSYHDISFHRSSMAMPWPNLNYDGFVPKSKWIFPWKLFSGGLICQNLIILKSQYALPFDVCVVDYFRPSSRQFVFLNPSSIIPCPMDALFFITEHKPVIFNSFLSFKDFFFSSLLCCTDHLVITNDKLWLTCWNFSSTIYYA